MADEVKFTDSTTDLSEGESNATLGEKAWYVVNTYSTHENKKEFQVILKHIMIHCQTIPTLNIPNQHIIM